MRPASEEELAEMIRAARGPLRVTGGGTRPMGRAGPGEVLETGGLSGIVLHEPGALTLVVRAGTPLAEVEAALAAEGQQLAFEPADWRGLLGTSGEPTIGGVAAANVSGPRRVQAGACRDALIGVRFVDGAGAVVKNGGRVMKNVTGYDLVKLMAGSRGALGVLTELSFKLLPVPEAAATLRLSGLDAAQAVAAMSAALGTPWEVSGAAWLPGEGVLLRLEGFAASVAYRAGRLAAALAGFGAAEVVEDPAAVAALWRRVREVEPFHGRAGDVWRFSVRPSEAPGVVALLGGEAVLDWGGGLLWTLLPEGMDARALAAPCRGHATLMRGAPRPGVPVFQPEPAPVAALAAGLRAKFDPRGILDPGIGEAA